MRKTLFALYFVTSALGFTQETVSTEILRIQAGEILRAGSVSWDLLQLRTQSEGLQIDTVAGRLWPRLTLDLNLFSVEASTLTGFDPLYLQSFDTLLEYDLGYGIGLFTRFSNDFVWGNPLGSASSVSGGLELPLGIFSSYWKHFPGSNFEELELRKHLQEVLYLTNEKQLQWDLYASWLRLGLLERLLTVKLEKIEVYEKRIEETELRWLQGRVNRIELTNTEIAADRVQDEYFSTNEQLRSLRADLAEYDFSPLVELDKNKVLEVLMAEALFSELRQTNYEIALGNNLLSRWGIMRQIQSALPNLSFSFSMDPSSTTSKFANPFQGVQDQWSTTDPWAYTFSISTEFPVTPFASSGISIESSILNVEINLLEQKQLEQDRATDLEALKASDETRRAFISRLERQLSLEKERRESLIALVNGGRVLSIELEEQELLVLEAELSLALSKLDYIRFKLINN